jgi:hypothetical protein
MVMFFRGPHRPVCRIPLAELDRRPDELSARGIDIVAISDETRERSQQLQADRKLRVPIAYGPTEPSMRAWGPFVSRGRSDDEPPPFSEPGLSYSPCQTERSTTSRSCRCQPVGATRTSCCMPSTAGRRSTIPPAERHDVGDTPARSTQNRPVLHCDTDGIRLSGEHDSHQAGHPKRRNQPVER